jgi:hypothetical protein
VGYVRRPTVLIITIGVIASVGIAARRAEAVGTPLDPGASVCPGAVGSPGAVAVLNLTPVEAAAGGFGAVRASDAPSNNTLGEAAVSNVNFRVGSIDPNVALAAIGADGRVCFDNSPHAAVQLVADQMGVMPATAYQPASATGARRLLDTRRLFVEGGPATGALAPGASVCPKAVGDPGRVAVVNVTPLEATNGGFGAVRASDAPSNNTLGEAAVSNVNFRVGSVDPNLAFAKIGSDGRICFDNSPHATIHLIIDQMGSLPADALVPAAASGATRLIDTRRGLVVGGTATHSIAPGAAVCAKAVGQPGDVAVVNGTPVDAGGAGFMAVRASDAPSNNTLGDQAVSNWNFDVASVDPNVAFAKIGPDGSICVDNSPHATVQMVLDQAGYIPSGRFTPPAATGAARLVDSRRDFVAAPAPPPPPPEATVPGPPTGLSATAGPGSLALHWNPPTDDGGTPIDEYRLERGATGSGPWTLVAETVNTSHTDVHLSPSIDHWYRVIAHNAVGWGSPSSPLSGRALPPGVPGPVRNLSPTSDDTNVTLTWLPPSDDGGAGITHYIVRNALNCNQNSSSASNPLTIPTFTHTALISGTTYCYTVSAVNAAGTGPGLVLEVRVGRPTAPAPCPMLASWYPVQDGSVSWSLELSWNTPADDGSSPITSYAVSWFDAVTTATIHTEVLPATARTAFLDQVDPGKGYQASVRASNAGGLGVACLTAVVTPG